MSTLAEIEEAVAKLPAEQFSELLRKMQERDAETWDREMEEDAKSGRIDALHARLEQENAGEPEVPLDDFLDQGKFSKTFWKVVACHSAGSERVIGCGCAIPGIRRCTSRE